MRRVEEGILFQHEVIFHSLDGNNYNGFWGGHDGACGSFCVFVSVLALF